MNPEELKQKIAEYYAKLPARAQEIFSSMQWLETLKEISEKYKLNDKQIETLGTETMLVLLGIIDQNEYEQILSKEIALPRYSMDEMLVTINDSVLKGIRTDLMKAFEQNNNEPTEEEISSEEKIPVETKLDNRFSKIPEETKEAISKSNYQTALYEIGKKYNLTVFQMGELERFVVGIMTGKTSSIEFAKSLENLQLPKEKLEGITNDANEKIFKNIRKELMGEIDSLDEEKDNTLESREELLRHIENPSKISTPQKIIIPDLTKQQELLAPEEEIEISAPETNQPKKTTPSILTQKLAGSFQIPKVETEHSLTNMTKAPETTKKGLPKADPYRELPE